MPTSLSGQRVLVTGGAGFLGSHLTRRLVQEGAEVTSLDNFSYSRPDTSGGHAAPGIREISADLRRTNGVQGVFEAVHPDLVFHLAAVANPRVCQQDFALAFEVNVVGTHNILRHAPAAARIVLMSSASVYGAPERLPIDEGHPRNGQDPYAITKIMDEDLAGAYVRTHRRDIVIVRNFNTFGVGQTGDYIVPQLIRQALQEGRIELWDATTVRDLMYVDDTIEALLAVAHHGEATVYNVGTGRGLAVGDLARLVAERAGKDVPVVDLKKKVVGSAALIADNRRLQSLGWSERVGLEQGLDRTIEWARAQPARPAG